MSVIEKHFMELSNAVSHFDHQKILTSAQIIYDAHKRKNRVYTFGNGGSASTAEHFAAGLLKELGVNAICLNSLPLNTAMANDEGYEYMFSKQLEHILEFEDVVVAISYSGNSPNVVQALAKASRFALLAKRILITGPLKHPYQISACDIEFHVNTNDIMVAEDMHLAICHSIEKQVRKLIEDDQANG